MDKISVIIPFFNEEENIPNLINQLELFFGQNLQLNAEVIFVNDGSTDNSLALLGNYKPQIFSLKIISLTRNFGSHAALRAGILHAIGDYISFLYADLQDPPQLINEMLVHAKKDNSIVWAIRNKTDNSWTEKFFSKTYSALMKKYAISSYPEKGFDVVMFNKKVQQNLNANIESNSSVFLQILALGYKQATISYNKFERKKGKSKWTLKKKIKLFIDSFVAFSYAPIRFVTVMGFVFFLLGFLWTVYVLYRKIFVGDIVSGWAGLVSILFLGFGLTNISLGIIAEYLWRTLDASRKRPVFVIDEIIVVANGK